MLHLDTSRRPLPSIALALALLAPASLCAARSYTLETPRGASLELTIHTPRGRARRPALLIAPGRGYHKELPLVKELASRAARAGFVALRFDWAYHPDGLPSEDLGAEVEDMQTVLRYARAHHRVDRSQVYLAGKSLGTLVAYRLFRRTPSAAGLVLLTPVCSMARPPEEEQDGETAGGASGEAEDDEDDLVELGDEHYPGIDDERRPVLVVLGDRDPLCDVPTLYDFLDDTGGNVAVGVVGGDHSMNLGPWDGRSFRRVNADNRLAALRLVLHHLSMWRRR